MESSSDSTLDKVTARYQKIMVFGKGVSSFTLEKVSLLLNAYFGYVQFRML